MKSNKVMNIYELISKNQSYKITKNIEIDYPLEYKSGKEKRREKSWPFGAFFVSLGIILKTNTMSPFKKAKVILLPTGFIARRNEIGLQAYKTNLRIINNTEEEDLIFYQQHLYIISDDEIKKGDWKYDTKLNIIIQHGSYVDGCKKIIATTDTSLGFSSKINHGVSTTTAFTSLPQPSKQFIEKYIEEYNKGNIITDVLIEYELISNEEYFGNTVNPDNDVPYFDEKLKINPKDNTITIKKIKDSRNKEEQTDIIEKYLFTKEIDVYRRTKRSDIKKWIEENL